MESILRDGVLIEEEAEEEAEGEAEGEEAEGEAEAEAEGASVMGRMISARFVLSGMPRVPIGASSAERTVLSR